MRSRRARNYRIAASTQRTPSSIHRLEPTLLRLLDDLRRGGTAVFQGVPAASWRAEPLKNAGLN